MSDWTTARVVRDRDGELWGRDGSSAYWDYVGTCGYSGGVPASLVAAGGDPTPVLDADGLPVVRTVGDLTAWHIGKRVRAHGRDWRLVSFEADGPFPGAMPCLTVTISPADSTTCEQQGVWCETWLLAAPCEVLP